MVLFVRHNPQQLLLLSSFILLLFSSVVVVYVSFWRGFHDILFYFIILMPLSLSTVWNKSQSYYNTTNTNTNTNKSNTAVIIIRIFFITSIIITCLQIIRIHNINTDNSYGNHYEQQQHQQHQQPNGKNNSNKTSSSSSSSSSSEEPIKKMRNKNNSNHNHNNKNKKKKFFVLHIGPSKTGTTSIQKDSGSKDFYTELQKDNTIYVGKFADPSNTRSDSDIQNVWNKSKNCMIQFYKKEISGNSSKNKNDNNNYNKNEQKQRKFTSIQKEYYRKLLLQKCLPIEYQYILQGSNNNEDSNQNDDDGMSGMSTGMMNIIDSDERYSYYKPDVRDLEEITNIFIHIFDYTEILLVGSYRQYSNWIISTYGEWSRQKCLKKYLYFPSMQQKELEIELLEQEQELLSISDRTISKSKSKSKTKSKSKVSSIKLNSKKNSGTCPNIWSSYIMDHVNGSYSKNNYRGRYTFYNNIDTTLNLILSNTNTNNGITTNVNVSNNSNASNNNNSNSNSNNLSSIPSGVSIHILNFFQQSPDNSKSKSNSNSNSNDSKSNNYNHNSITTEFYCKILGIHRTPNTCQHSKERKVKDIIRHREMGTYNLERVLYDTISIELFKRLRYNKRYRYIGGAGSSLLVDTKVIHNNNNNNNNNNVGKIRNSTAALLSDRLELRKYIHDYHRRYIIESLSSESKSESDSDSVNNSTTNTTSSSISMVNYLPLLCPSKMELHLLLNKSIQFEELVIPFLIFDNNNNNNYDTNNDNNDDNNDDSTSTTNSSANNGIMNNNNNNNELSRQQQQSQSQSQLRYRQQRIVQMKKEHISNFWNILVNKKKSFCWIDIPRLFAIIDNNNTESITSSSSSISSSLLLSLDDILDTLFTTTKWTTTVIAD